MARRISVDIVGDSRSLERAFSRSSRSASRFNREIGRASRGALVGSGALSGLGRAATFASSSFIGGAGVVYGLKSTIDAAMESQRVLAQTSTAVKNSGLSWKEYGSQVEAASSSLSLLSGFDDEELLGTFSAMVRSTGDVSEALRLNALAANVARGANIELARAQKVVLRAQAGQAKGLAVLGVNAKAGATGLELINQLNEKFAGSADAYGRTAAGSMDRFKVSIENAQESIGKALLPKIAELSTQLAEFLNKPETQTSLENFGGRVATGLTVAGKTATLFERLNKNAEAFDKSVALALLSPLRIIPRVNQSFESLRDSMRDTTAAATTMGLAFSSALNEGLSLKGAQGTAAGATSIPGSVSGTTSGFRFPGPPGTGTPYLGLLLAAAEGTKGRGDDERVLKRIIAVLRGRLGGTSNLKARTELTNAINQFAGTLAGLQEQDAQVITDAAQKAKDRRQKAHDAAVEALRKLNESIRRQEELARSFTVPISLQIAAAKATTTKTEKDDRAIAQATKRFAEIAIKSGRLRGQGLIDAYNTIAAANAQMASRVTSAQQDADLSYLAALDRRAFRDRQTADKLAGGVVVNVTGTYDGRHGAEAAGHVIARGINRR